MKIRKVVSALERFAPLPLQEDYDNAGLQVGLTEAEVSGALLCLDVTEAVLDEAIERGCNLIVSHHPLIFHRLRRLCAEDYVQRVIMRAIESHIAIVSMHTNLDAANGGVNYKIAEVMGLQDPQPLGKRKEADGVGGSEGVVGLFAEPITAQQFVSLLKDRFRVECVMANQLLLRPIRKVAICGGAGDFLLSDAIVNGADAFVTGEMHYHQYFGHEQEIQIAVIGHYQSEQFTKELLRDIILRECLDVRCCISNINTNPIITL